jgi:hypothetical protein
MTPGAPRRRATDDGRNSRPGAPDRTDPLGPDEIPRPEDAPDLGDLVVVLVASSLAGLRDRLADDGFASAADLVADLVEAADDYLFGLDPPRPSMDGEHPACR